MKMEIRTLIFLLAITFLTASFSFGKESLDTPHYERLITFFRGETNLPENSAFAIRPVIPLIATPLSYLIGVRYAYSTINVLCCMLAVLFAYLFFKKVFGTKIAGISALFFSISLPIMIWGGRPVSDAGGWLALFLLLYLIERIDNPPLLGVMFGLASLTRNHSVIIAGSYLFLKMIFIEKEKFRAVMQLIGVIVITGAFYFGYQLVFDLTSTSQYIANFWYGLSVMNFGSVLSYFFKLAITFHIGWILVFLSLRKKWNKIHRKHLWILALSVIPITIVCFFVCDCTPRQQFLLAPLILPLMAKSFNKIEDYTWWIVIFGITSVIGWFLFPAVNIPDYAGPLELIKAGFSTLAG